MKPILSVFPHRCAAPLLAVVVIAAAGCQPPVIERIEPQRVSCFGYVQLTITGQNFVAPGMTVTVGGVPAIIDSLPNMETLRITVQGSPQPGPVDVVVSTWNGTATLPAEHPRALRYLPSADPQLFRKIVAMGASFSFGIQNNSAMAGYRLAQNGGIAEVIGGQMMCPSALFARQAGAFCPQPLAIREGIPPRLIADDVAMADPLDPDPDGSGQLGQYFTHPWTGGQLWKPAGEAFNPALDIPGLEGTAGIEEILGTLLLNWIIENCQPLNEVGVLRLSRETQAHNFAVPGLQMIGTLHGAMSGLSALGWLSIDPHRTIIQSLLVSKSQIKHITEIDPSLILNVDLYGNSVMFNHPRDDVFKCHLLLLLIDLAMSEWLADPLAPYGAPGIPYVDIEPESGVISHEDKNIKWSPFFIDWAAIPDPELRDLIEQLLAWLEENQDDFGEWSVGWEIDRSLVADFTRIQLPDGTMMADLTDDTNGDGWVDADELLPHIRRILDTDPDPSDNPLAVVILEVWNMMLFASGSGSPDDRDTGIRFNGYLNEIAAAINTVQGDVILVAPTYEFGQQLAAEDVDCAGAVDLTDLNGDGAADVFLRLFGGFFSLDGLHPANLGYAALTNLMIETINNRYYGGSQIIPTIDLREVWEKDYLAPVAFPDSRVHPWAEEMYEAPCDE